MKTVNQFVLFIILGLGLASCSKKTGQVVVSPHEPSQVGAETSRAHEKHITILATNDIHGGVEPTVSKAGKKAGGMAIFSGVVNAIRTGLKNKYGADGGVLLVDGGDQFQGTLLSNYSEGKLVFDIMNHIGYDAAVLGNHDFDFGPEGWLQDKVVAGEPDQDPRGALKKLVASKNPDFHLISANIYYTNSIVKDGKSGEQIPVKVKPIGCEALNKDDAKAIRWDQARRFELAQPYAIKNVAGVRVAMIGIENVETPQTTTPENVSDLCFRDAADSYLEIREQLEGQADVFIMVTHNGNTNNDSGATDMVKKILKQAKDKENILHAVVAGHTHYVNQVDIEGIPLIQSKADGKYFGRIDLVWDANFGKLIKLRTHYDAGINLTYGECPASPPASCTHDKKNDKVFYEGIEVTADPEVEKLISDRRVEIAPLAGKVLGRSKGDLTKDYYKENSMSDRVTDEFLKMIRKRVPGLEGKNLVTLINGGGVRAPLRAGEFTYEDWFRVFPFNNRIAMKGPVKVEQLVKVMKRGVDTCGSHGGLTPGGIRVQFNRECADKPEPKEFKLIRIKLPDESGGVKVIYDSENGIIDDGEIWIATLDFLAAGGSGYTDFKEMPDFPLSATRAGGVDLIFREALSEYFEAYPPEFDPNIDHRLQNLLEDLKDPQKITQLFR
jgi:5'-nucleotidase